MTKIDDFVKTGKAVETRKNLRRSPDISVKRKKQLDLWGDDVEEAEIHELHEEAENERTNTIQLENPNLKSTSPEIETKEVINVENSLAKKTEPEVDPINEITKAEEAERQESKLNRKKQILSTLGDISVPAFQRFKSLVPVTKLDLPKAYKHLVELFSALDSAIIFAKSRNQVFIFTKMQKALENILSKNIVVEDVGRVKRIYPESLKIEPLKVLHLGKMVDTILVELRRADDQIITKNGKQSIEFGNEELAKRKSNFYKRVLDIVKDAHLKFLKDRGIELKEEIVKWHSEFDLDHVTVVEPMDIPLTKKPQQSLNEPQTSKIEEPQLPKEKLSLLERIRLKEKQNEVDKMTGSKTEENRLKQLKQLPALCDSLQFLFTSSKKNVMFMGEVMAKLIASAKIPVSTDDMSKLIKLLSNLCPEWCVITENDAGSLVRIDKSIPLKQVKEKLRWNRPLQKQIAEIERMPHEADGIIQLKTAPFDPRFPNTNQTKNCWQNFVDFHKCVQAKGEDYKPCKEFQRVYRIICPESWVTRWQEAIDENRSPFFPPETSDHH